MADIRTTEYNYKLRAATPMPVETGKFLLQTFKAERTDTYNYSYKETDLPRSNQFRGQYGSEQWMSAQFNRLLDKSGAAWQGRIVQEPHYVKEEFLLKPQP